MRRRSFGFDSAGPRIRRKSASRPRIEALEGRCLMATLTVTNIDDNGPGSLRQAILDANSMLGSDVINFNIATPGVHTIALTTTSLPTIVDTVLIDGTTQPTNGGDPLTTPLIQIDGSALAGAGNDGLSINLPNGTAPSTIRGLAIGGFSGSGVIITGTGGNAVQQSLIGTNAAGTAALANGSGITITDSPNNTIGGTQTAFRNIISGNTVDGIRIAGAASVGNLVQGNLIGIDIGGVAAIPNGSGIEIVGASNNTIGGAVVAARNVVSGNTGTGIRITASGGSNNSIQGNYVGLNATGNGAVPNGIGVQIDTAASSNTIGGTAVANRNVVAGNITANVVITGSSSNLIVGNTIGLNLDGNAAINTTQATTAGLVLQDGAIGNTIGGISGTANNVISGSAGPNVLIQGKSNATITATTANNLLQGNFIGTNLAGTGAASTTAGGGGIVLAGGTTGNTVGGSSSGLARNVISGNFGPGIILRDAGTTGNSIQGNNIGVQTDATTILANTGEGILVDGATNNTIGASTTGAGNVIAGNGAAGVFVNSGTGIAIQRNSIFSNAGLGIDLAPIGVNANQPTNPAVGPNNLQNYPVLTGVTTTNGVTTVTGTLHSTPSSSITIELFSNTVADPSGNGQGRTFAGSVTVTTNASGDATFSTATLAPVALNSILSATATDGAGNTSEFSANLVNAAPSADLVVTLIAAPEPVAAGGFLTYTITVSNNGPSNATNVVLTNTLPSTVSFIGATSSTGSITQSGSTVTATVGALASGATATITVTVVSPLTSGSITSSATATLTESDPNSANNTSTFTSTVVQGPNLVVTTSVTPSTVGVGSTATITYVVTNASTTVSANVVNVTAPLSSNATVVSVSSSQGSAITADGMLTASIGTLAPGASATINLVLSPTATGTILTTATATSDAPNVNPMSTSATATLVVTSSTTPVVVDGPRVLGLDRAGFHFRPAFLTLTFDSTLVPTTARNLANYRLVSAGHDGRFGTRDDRVIRIASASYDNTARTVRLRTRKPVGLRQLVQLTAVGVAPDGIRGTGGLLLDGADTGTPGSNFVEAFRGVGPGRISAASIDAAIASIASKRR